ncbi:fungal fruit body lectin [Russula dissimulans]|nr:fungal fruit body lectin [Russula dissimulans]KAH9954039.1 fungal fruit body lectin [Russula dissimulans]
MGYKIIAQVYQTNTNAFFHVAEQYGTWSEVNGAYVLTMGGSGTSGSLRFVSDTEENFILTLGIHNYRRWGDIVTDLTPEQTAKVINAQYYNSAYPSKAEKLWAQLTNYQTSNAKGRTFKFIYTALEGEELNVKIIIG